MSGWGRFTWGQAEWGEDELLATGWGAKAYGAGEWGDLSGEVVQPTGLSITSTLNDSVTISGNAVVAISGQQISSTLGTISNVVSVTVDPNGLEMNDLQGTAQASIDVTPTITGLSTTAAIGVIDPKDQVIGAPTLTVTSQQGTAFAPNEDVSVTGQSITSTLGTPTTVNAVFITPNGFEMSTAQGSVVVPNDAVAPTGLEIASSIGFVVGAGSVSVPVTGISMSSQQGTIVDIPDQIMGLTGVSFSAAIGSVDPKDQVVGLTGLSMTATVGEPFIIHYQDVDTGSNTSYSALSTGSNSNYSNVATGSNTSYTDAA
jgi:hypothetical protein